MAKRHLPGVRRSLARVRTRVSSKDRIALPASLRKPDRIGAPTHKAGVVDWLLSCPEKDFFVSIPSEFTETLRRSRVES